MLVWKTWMSSGLKKKKIQVVIIVQSSSLFWFFGTFYQIQFINFYITYLAFVVYSVDYSSTLLNVGWDYIEYSYPSYLFHKTKTITNVS